MSRSLSRIVGPPRRAMLAAALLIAGAAPTLAAAAAPAGPAAPAPHDEHLIGDYLAGRHAQQVRDFPAAASWYEKAILADPQAPELISRTFVMEVSVGRFEKARALADEELKLDPTDPLAKLVLLVDRLRSGDAAGAQAAAADLPKDGLHRFVGPLALAWTRMAAKNLPGAEAALQGLDRFNGLEPLKRFQLGLLYDFSGDPDKAKENFDKALGANPQLNWRMVDVVANFLEHHGKRDEAKALYDRFLRQNTGSELAQSVLSARGSAPQPPAVRSAADGLAEAMFDLASVLNQAETIDLSLVYTRFALALRPDFPLAQLLLSDVLSTQNKPEQSLAVLEAVPRTSPYSWSARLRMTVNLDTLDRTEESIAMLKAMAAEMPQSLNAQMQLGDIYRSKKRFPEAVEAYDEAMRRAAAGGDPDRWTLYYDRGVALERSNRWDRAEGDLVRALELKPDQPLILNYLGYSWIDRGLNLERGLKMIEKAVELRPEDGYILDSLGWAHYRLGNVPSAIEHLEKAIELVPEDPTINDHLGDAYWRDGRLVEARYQWRRALQFNPPEDEVKPIEAKLERGLVTPASATPSPVTPAQAPGPGSARGG